MHYDLPRDLPPDDHLRDALRQAGDTLPASAPGPGLAGQLAIRAIARQRKRRAAAIMTSSLLVVGAATTVIALRPDRERPIVLAIDPETARQPHPPSHPPAPSPLMSPRRRLLPLVGNRRW